MNVCGYKCNITNINIKRQKMNTRKRAAASSSGIILLKVRKIKKTYVLHIYHAINYVYMYL